MEELRGSGQTTRLVDYYVQLLFNNKELFIEPLDHYNHKQGHKELLTRIIKRIELEHPKVSFKIDKNKIKINEDYK